jgi:hypothetical protein
VQHRGDQHDCDTERRDHGAERRGARGQGGGPS